MKTVLNTKIINTSRYLSSILLSLVIAVSFSSTVFAAPASDPQASAKAQAVLDYLTNLPSRTSNKVVAGQHSGLDWNPDNLIEDIHTATGKYPGLAGVDFFYANDTKTQNQVISWSNANSLITILHHWNNPVTNSQYVAGQTTWSTGSAWDTTSVDFVQLVTKGTALNTTFNGYLDKLATGLQVLQNNNVVVLYRPFHEMNGSWFWWGNKDATQFKNAWIYVFNYLTKTKGLHNLLFVYSPNVHSDMTKYYPGSQYVDVVGMDLYGAVSVTDTTDYNTLIALNKPFGLTEYGPCSASGCSSAVDWSAFIASLISNMPKTTFWMNWSGSWSMKYNTGTSNVLNNSSVITRDEIALSAGQALLPPSGLHVVSAP